MLTYPEMITYTRAQIERLLKIDFVRFCIVGGTGFIINFALLTLLHKVLKVEIFAAQIVSAEIALFSNFMLHHHWTYKSHKVTKSKRNLILQFHAASWPAIVGSASMVWAGERLLHFGYLLSLTTSSIIVLSWNFGWSKYVIWKDVSKLEVERVIK